MTEGKKRTKTTSLRRRVMLASLGMLAVALIALDATIYVGLRSRYYGEVRDRLSSAIAAARDRVVPLDPLTGRPMRPTDEANELSDAGVAAAIYRSGEYPVISQSLGTRSEAPKLPQLVTGYRMTPAESWAAFREAVDSRSDLLWEETNPIPDSTDTVLFVVSKEPARQALNRLLIAEVLGTLLVLVLATVLMRRAVGLALRPLDRMASVASSISAGEIGQRLRPTRSGTELGKLATALDAMLDSLATSLESERKARERARLSEDRMRVFLSDASHELRTPIAGLQWSAEALLREGEGSVERERLAFRIAQQARRASRLVTDLLAIARLDQGMPLEQERFDLAALAEEEVDRARETEPRTEVGLTTSGDCRLVGDPERIRQVIANLIENSRRVMDGKGTISVSVERHGGRIELAVTDSGPGVPEADRERIFERFVRLEDARPRSRPESGSGLGLAIARGIAEAHGGSLVCAPSEKGARFVLTLPLGKGAGKEAPASATTPS
jgi:two-component system OmpR family sensor kinase